MHTKHFASAVLIAATALAVPTAAHATAPSGTLVCVSTTIGPDRPAGMSGSHAPIQYGYKISCMDGGNGDPIRPDDRTITVSLQTLPLTTDSRDPAARPRVVASWAALATDPQKSEAHLFDCYGGEAAQYNVHLDVQAHTHTSADEHGADSGFMAMEC